MQKRPVRMRALALDVMQEVTPTLASARRSDHRRHRHRRLGAERQLARQHAPYAISLDRALRQWVLEANEPLSDGDGTPLHRARHLGAARPEVDERDLSHRKRRA